MSLVRAPALIVVSVALGLMATLLWRAALIEVGGFTLGPGGLRPLGAVALSWQFWVGALTLIGVVIITLDLYSNEDLSRVIPMYSLSYVAIAIIGKLWLGEAVQTMRWLGIALVVAGVVLIVRT